MRSSKPDCSGSMRVNSKGLPHLEQGGRTLFDIVVLSAIRDRYDTHPRGAAKQSPKFLGVFRASQKIFPASQRHFGESPLFSLPRFARDHAASRGPLLAQLALRRLNRVRAVGLSSLSASGTSPTGAV